MKSCAHTWTEDPKCIHCGRTTSEQFKMLRKVLDDRTKIASMFFATTATLVIVVIALTVMYVRLKTGGG